MMPELAVRASSCLPQTESTMMGTLCDVAQGTTPGAAMYQARSVSTTGMTCGMKCRPGTDI